MASRQCEYGSICQYAHGMIKVMVYDILLIPFPFKVRKSWGPKVHHRVRVCNLNRRTTINPILALSSMVLNSRHNFVKITKIMGPATLVHTANLLMVLTEMSSWFLSCIISRWCFRSIRAKNPKPEPQEQSVSVPGPQSWPRCVEKSRGRALSDVATDGLLLRRHQRHLLQGS